MAGEMAKVKAEGAAALAEAHGAAHAAEVENQALQAKLESSLQDFKTRCTSLTHMEPHQCPTGGENWRTALKHLVFGWLPTKITASSTSSTLQSIIRTAHQV